MVYKQFSIYTSNSVDQDYISFAIQGSLYVDRFKVLEVNVPQCWYTTTTANNTIAYSVAGVTYKTTIAPGTYTVSTFPAVLTAAMQITKANSWTCVYNANTRRFTIGGTTAFSLLPFTSGTTMFLTLGLPKYGAALTGTSVTCNACDLTNNSPLLLTSANLASKDCVYVGGASSNVNVMCVVTRSATPTGAFINYLNPGGWLRCEQEISVIDLSLLDGATLGRIPMSQQPFEVIIGVLTDQDDGMP